MPQFFIALLFDKWDLVQSHICSLQWFYFFFLMARLFLSLEGKKEEKEEQKKLKM